MKQSVLATPLSPVREGRGDEEQGGAREEGSETGGREGRKSTAPDNSRQRLTTVPN